MVSVVKDQRTIVTVCLSRSWGGLEMFVVDFTQYLAQDGYRSVLVGARGAPLVERARALEIEVSEVGPSGYFRPSTILAVRRLIRQLNPQAVVLHWLKDLWVVVPALLGSPGTRLVGFAHMIVREVSKKDLLHRWLYRRLSRLIAISPGQLEGFRKNLPVRDDQLVVCPHGVDLARYTPSLRDREFRRDELGIGEELIAVGVIGRLDPQKGQMEFIEAVSALKSQHPKARFLIVGEEPKGELGFRKRLEDRVEALKVHDVVRFLGFRSDVPKVMANLDILVVPSYEETFGLVVIEGMASGVPVVATDAGGIPFIIEHGKSGVLVRPKSAQAIVDALGPLLRSADSRCELAQRGRARAQDFYDIRMTLKRQEQEVLGQP